MCSVQIPRGTTSPATYHPRSGWWVSDSCAASFVGLAGAGRGLLGAPDRGRADGGYSEDEQRQGGGEGADGCDHDDDPQLLPFGR